MQPTGRPWWFDSYLLVALSGRALPRGLKWTVRRGVTPKEGHGVALACGVLGVRRANGVTSGCRLGIVATRLGI